MNERTARSNEERVCWIILGFFLIALSFSLVSLSGSWPRYIMYLLPGIVVFLALSQSRDHPITIDIAMATFLMLYTVATFVTTLYHTTVTFFTIRDFLFLVIPFFTFAYWFHVPERAIKVLFFGLLLVQVFNAFAQVHHGETLGGSVSLSESKGLVESPLGSILGGMFLFFLLRGQFFYAVVAFVAVFVAFKRFSLAGMIIALIAYAGLRFLDGNFRTAKPGLFAKVALVIFTIACVIVSRNLNELVVYLDQFINLYDTHPEQLLLGRYALNNIAFHYMFDVAGFWETMIGYGVGSTTALIQPLSGIALLHNDLLKIQAEYGLIGLVLILAGWWRVFCRTYFGMALYAYSMILWLSDNTLIYVFHSFVMLMLIRFEQQQSLQATQPTSGGPESEPTAVRNP